MSATHHTLSWFADVPNHDGWPELILRTTPGLQRESNLRWRARCTCGWVGETEYLGTSRTSDCPPATSAATKAEWESHIAGVTAG